MRTSMKALLCLLGAMASVDAFAPSANPSVFGTLHVSYVPKTSSAVHMVAGGASAYEQEMYDGAFMLC